MNGFINYNTSFCYDKKDAEPLKRNTFSIVKIKFIPHLFSLFIIICLQSIDVELFSQQLLQIVPKIYIFNGNGNWSKVTNWQSSIKPPGLVPKGDSILIQTAPGDSCVLDVAQYLAEGAVIKVVDGNSLIIKSGILQFVPADSFFTDSRDNKIYPIKKYGTQIWMTMNLNYNQAGSKIYDNVQANAAIYGRLYNWDQAKSAIPTGWHLPTVAEWNTLITFLGGAGPMKDTLYWQASNTAASNSSGFSARPGGLFAQPDFEDIGNFGLWWTATEYAELGSFNWAFYFQAGYNSGAFYSDYSYKNTYAFSVRCVKN